MTKTYGTVSRPRAYVANYKLLNSKSVKAALAKSNKHLVLAKASEAKGDFKAANKDYRMAFDLRYRALGQADPVVMDTVHKLAHVNQKLKDYNSAESYLNWCLKAKAKAHDPGEFEFADTYAALGNLYLEQKHYDKAIKRLDQVVALHERYKGSSNQSTFKAKKALAKAYLKSGDRNKFEEIVSSARLASVRVKTDGKGIDQANRSDSTAAVPQVCDINVGSKD